MKSCHVCEWSRVMPSVNSHVSCHVLPGEYTEKDHQTGSSFTAVKLKKPYIRCQYLENMYQFTQSVYAAKFTRQKALPADTLTKKKDEAIKSAVNKYELFHGLGFCTLC